MPRIVSRTTSDTSTYVSVVISPATTTRPVVISVSQAQRPPRSSRRTASRTASETWSAILSGCPSVTDSDVKRNSRDVTGRRLSKALDLPDVKQHRELRYATRARRIGEEALERREILREVRRNRRVAGLGEALDQRDRGLDVDIDKARRLIGEAGGVLRLREDRVAGDRRSDGPDDVPARVADHDRAAGNAVVDRHRPKVELLERADCGQLAVQGDREPRRNLVQRRHRSLRVSLLQDERHLRERDAGRHVQDALSLDQVRDVGQADPEQLLELAGGLRLRRVLRQLLRQLRTAVEGREGERAGRHLREQRRLEVLAGGLARLHRALELRGVGLRRERQREPLQLSARQGA